MGLLHSVTEVAPGLVAWNPDGHLLHTPTASHISHGYFLEQILHLVLVLSFLATDGSTIVPGGQTVIQNR